MATKVRIHVEFNAWVDTNDLTYLQLLLAHVFRYPV